MVMSIVLQFGQILEPFVEEEPHSGWADLQVIAETDLSKICK